MLGASRRGPHLSNASVVAGAAALITKAFPQQMPLISGTMVFTLGAPAQVVGLAGAMLPGGAGTFAIGGVGSTTTGGYVAAVEAGFAAGAPAAGVTTRVDDNDITNAVVLHDSVTNDAVETADGEEVFGLLHAAAGTVDGDAMAFGGGVNVQISFIYKTLADPTVLAAFTLPAGTYYFAPRQHQLLSGLGYRATGKDAETVPDERSLVNWNNIEVRQRTVAANYVFDASGPDEHVKIDASGGVVDVDLPDVLTNLGRRIQVTALDIAFAATVTGQGTDVVRWFGGNQNAVYTFGAQYDSVTLEANSDGGIDYWLVV